MLKHIRIFHNFERKEHNWKPTEKEENFLKESGYSCSCCGIKTKPHSVIPSGFLEILEIDNNKFTLCSVCMSSQLIGSNYNKRINHGSIVYLPSATQGDVSKLSRYRFEARRRNGEHAIGADILFAELKNEPQMLCDVDIPGFTTGDVEDLLSIFDELPVDLQSLQSKYLKNYRYIPSEQDYLDQINFWSKSSMKHLG